MNTEQKTIRYRVEKRMGKESRLALPKALGLKKTQVSSSISYLRRIGLIEAPTEEETKKTLRESVSQARGGISLAIEPYMKMGMSPMEIQIALAYKGIDTYSLKQINQCVAKSRMRGIIPPLNEFEKRDARRNSSMDKEIIQRKVFFWLEASRVANLINHEINGRMGWMSWITKCAREGLFVIDGVYNGADEKGMYRASSEGKWRQIGESGENGELMFDSLQLRNKRESSRNRNIRLVS